MRSTALGEVLAALLWKGGWVALSPRVVCRTLLCPGKRHSVSPVIAMCPLPPGTLALPTNMITAHQLYNYIADHANTYHMKPLRMARPAAGSDNKKGTPGTEQNEYALVSIWNR